MTSYVVCTVAEMPPGTVRIVPVGNPQGIGVFNVAGKYYALKNVCPHQGGPLCAGTVTGTTRAVMSDQEAPQLEWERDGEIVRCPWHNIATGHTVFTSRMPVGTYRVVVGKYDPARPTSADRVETYPVVEIYPVKVENDLVILEL